MNFVNKFISRITTILSFILVFIQVYLALFMDQKDLAVFITSIVFIVLILANFIYQIFLYKKFNQGYETKLLNNDIAINLLVAGAALFFSVLDFVLAYFAYLYLIF